MTSSMKLLIYSACLIALTLKLELVSAAPSEAARSAAYQELEAGMNAFKAKDLLTGIMHYERAYRLAPDQKTLYTVAAAYDKLPNSCQKSLHTWERLMMRCKGQCPLLAKIKSGFKASQNKCNVKLSLKSTPHGADVIINDENYGTTPLTVVLPASAYQLQLMLDGSSLYQGPLKLKEGSKAEALSFNMAKGRFKRSKPSRSSKRAQKPKRSRKSKTRASQRSKTKRSKTKRRKKREETRAHDQAARVSATAQNAQNDERDEHEMELKSASPESVKVNASLQCMFRTRGGQYMPYPDCQGATLKEGDRFRVILSSQSDAYIYLFLSNSKGERMMLFPDPGVENHLRQGVEYVIPGQDWYELDENGGVKEQIRLIASRDPIPELERARGLDLKPEALKVLSQMSFRGVRRTRKPAKMSVHLKELDTVVSATGNDRSASVLFEIDHK